MFSAIKKWLPKRKSSFQQAFERALGENLFSLIQYGSSIKDPSEKLTNINLLIVLNRSTPEAHAAIYQILRENPVIEPFILGKRGFERTIKSFAVKFLSISRHYKLLSGNDVLADLNIPLSHERFLAEQALRNLRLRIVHCFATRGASKQYARFVIRLVIPIIVDISEVLRCEQLTVPVSYQQRVRVFSDKFDFDVSVLNELLKLKAHARVLTPAEIQMLHRNLFILLDNILLYIESEWHE